MTLLIKNGGYAFSIRLDLMLSMSLWREDLYRSIYDMFEVWDSDY